MTIACQRSDPNCPASCPYWRDEPDENDENLYGTEICPLWAPTERPWWMEHNFKEEKQ